MKLSNVIEENRRILEQMILDGEEYTKIVEQSQKLDKFIQMEMIRKNKK